jgi:ectoine hydroxylase-related dioxygenase (phytanoyl-CoA dioxygenase family)
MLSRDQLVHFAEHGWVLIEGVLDDAQCAAYVDAVERAAERRRPIDPKDRREEFTRIDNAISCDHLFVDWLRNQGILDANRQILGTQIRCTESFAHRTRPHPDRSERRAELMDPAGWGWHRGFRPKWAIFPDDDDPALVNCLYTTNITYLTPVSAGSGSTAVLDGSHLLEGDAAALREHCDLVEPPAAAGDVLIIAETLMHSAAPIVSETTRYALFYCFVPPWFANWPGYDVPQQFLDSLLDDDLRELLGPAHYRGQHPVVPPRTPPSSPQGHVPGAGPGRGRKSPGPPA